MPMIYADPRARAQLINLAQNMVRLRNPATGEYLHMSGIGTTSNAMWAWLGYRYQADTLRIRAQKRGDDWPYRPEQRPAEPKPAPAWEKI